MTSAKRAPRVRTMEQLTERFRENVAEVGGCLEWQGRYLGALPVMQTPAGMLFDGSVSGKQSARQLAWLIGTGVRAPVGRTLVMRCGNAACVDHLHMRAVKRGAHCTLAAADGKYKTTRRQAAALAARDGGRRPDYKLSLSDAAEIRASTEPTKVLALRYGVSPSGISAIRRGDRWATTAAAASVFTWRPAA